MTTIRSPNSQHHPLSLSPQSILLAIVCFVLGFLLAEPSRIFYSPRDADTDDHQNNHPLLLRNSNHGNDHEEGSTSLQLRKQFTRTAALVNQQLILEIFQGRDPMAVEPPASVMSNNNKNSHDNARTQSNVVFLEYLWQHYVKPNHGDLTFYVEVGCATAPLPFLRQQNQQQGHDEEASRGSRIIEWAQTIKQKYKKKWHNTSLVCLDPFSGSLNQWDPHTVTESGTYDENEAHHHMALAANGRPLIYEQFLAHVMEHKQDDMILPIVIGPLVGLKLLSRLHRPQEYQKLGAPRNKLTQLPSMIYLDSAHDIKELYLELEQAFETVRECGVIVGDDWQWGAVQADLRKFAVQQEFPSWTILQPYQHEQLQQADGEAMIQPQKGLMVSTKTNQWAIIKNSGIEACRTTTEGVW